MTRKDYILLAEALRYGLSRLTLKLWAMQAEGFTRVEAAEAQEHCEAQIAEALASDNPRFDREHFLALVRHEKPLNSRPMKSKKEPQ